MTLQEGIELLWKHGGRIDIRGDIPGIEFRHVQRMIVITLYHEDVEESKRLPLSTAWPVRVWPLETEEEGLYSALEDELEMAFDELMKAKEAGPPPELLEAVRRENA
jgi:hypothetical protein